MTEKPRPSGRPEPGELAEYAQVDIDLVPGDDAVTALLELKQLTLELFGSFTEDTAAVAYAPGKWSAKQVLGHLADDERIFAYRALCIARGDASPLPGFDENTYASAAKSDRLALPELLEDYVAVRHASVTLFKGLDPEAWRRTGMVNGYSATPRGLAFHIAGHELHHHRVLRDRYLPVIGR